MARRTAAVIRPAQVQAALIQWGDILITNPNADGGPKVIGTVLERADVPGGRAVQWRIRAGETARLSSPVETASYIWVHLPAGRA